MDWRNTNRKNQNPTKFTWILLYKYWRTQTHPNNIYFLHINVHNVFDACNKLKNSLQKQQLFVANHVLPLIHEWKYSLDFNIHKCKNKILLSNKSISSFQSKQKRCGRWNENCCFLFSLFLKTQTIYMWSTSNSQQLSIPIWHS